MQLSMEGMIMNMSERVSQRPDAEKLTLHWAIRCPETGRLAEVDIVAEPFPAFCMPIITIENCSLWPERKDCGQKCLGKFTEEADAAVWSSFPKTSRN
jgi:hypothetical protein